MARSGELAQGRRRAEAALRFANATGLAHRRGAAHDAYARVAAEAENWALVEEYATTAVADFVTAGAPIDEARSRELLAKARAAARKQASARAELDRAAALYRDCGADWFGARLAQVHGQLLTAVPGPATLLTHRERQVAELASGGMTNRQIASKLRLSQKTVEAHLAHIFTKLDVHSRVGLTRRLMTDPGSTAPEKPEN
jgi:DNA-binding NarL/FixJ family response regulator